MYEKMLSRKTALWHPINHTYPIANETTSAMIFSNTFIPPPSPTLRSNLSLQHGASCLQIIQFSVCAISDGFLISVLIRPRLEGLRKHIAKLIKGGLLGRFEIVLVKVFFIHLATHIFDDFFTSHAKLKLLLLPDVDNFFFVYISPRIL